MRKKKEIEAANAAVENANALIEMYKAGFLDGYRVKGKARTKGDFTILNNHYRKAFMKRFEKKITKELKKDAPIPIRKRKV